MFGIQLGWTAPTLLKLKNAEDFAASSENLSWIASSHEIGRILGPFLGAIVVNKIGRKYSLTICSISFFLLWLIMAFARSITVICCLRMLLGITQGVNILTTAIYFPENCTPKMRGIIGSLYPLYLNIGTITEYMLITYLTFETVAFVNAAIGFCGSLTCFFLKETPYFLEMKKQSERAKKNLMWLRGKKEFDSEVKLELDKIRENIQQEVLKEKSIVSIITTRENYKSLLIIIFLNLLFFMTGHHSIIAYSSLIFQPSSIFSSSEYTIIAGIFPLVSSCILPFIIERYDRRSICLSLLFILGSNHACLFLLKSMETNISKQCFSWLIFILTAVVMAVSILQISMTGIMTGELPPMSVKAIGNSLSVIMASSASATVVAIFLPITDAFGMKYNFLIYSIAAILLFLLILLVVPETRGKSLVDIQKSLRAKKLETA